MDFPTVYRYIASFDSQSCTSSHRIDVRSFSFHTSNVLSHIDLHQSPKVYYDILRYPYGYSLWFYRLVRFEWYTRQWRKTFIGKKTSWTHWAYHRDKGSSG